MARISLAANNADIGGGEVMLLSLARAMAHLGHDVSLVGPSADGGVLDEAADQGYPVSRLAGDRAAYVRDLRGWVRHHRTDLFWAGGLVPALATAGRPGRVVHLHRMPDGAQRYAARLARTGALATVVPSELMAARLPGTTALPNWTEDLSAPPRPADRTGPVRLGFLGRPGVDKGTDVLYEALALLDADDPGRFRLLVGGEPRFVPTRDQHRVAAALAPVRGLVEHGGWMAREDFFGRVDIAVFPSVWAEPFGLVAAEALSAAVPVVVSDAGALPEVVGAQHPWVARAGDARDLAAVVRACAEAPEAVRSAVVAAGRERWRTAYSPEAGTARLANLLGRLLPSPTTRP